jgi:alkylated DNA nucleotide flippase Atl1
VDRAALRRACALIPAGRWTSYGDLADALGAPGHARQVARLLARGGGIPNAHRVLRSTGRVAAGFRTGDCGGPEVARRLLEREGLRFDAGGAADPARRWVPPAGGGEG